MSDLLTHCDHSSESDKALQSLNNLLKINQCNQNEFFELVHRTLLQFVLEQICITMDKKPDCFLAVKRIYFKTADNAEAAQKAAKQICGIELDTQDSLWLDRCLHAHFRKKPRRKPISASLKRQLLEKQHYRCACCGAPITVSDCYDHIIPWDFVGDELEDNGQMLCRACNLNKSAKVYFEFQHKMIGCCHI